MIHTKLNKLVYENVYTTTSLPTKRIQVLLRNQHFQSFTYKTAAKTSWHRYGTKLRHCHPVYRPMLASRSYLTSLPGCQNAKNNKNRFMFVKVIASRACELFLRHSEYKGSPYSITECRVPELIPVLCSQPAGDVSHTPSGRLPLLSARPAVTPATLKRAATNFAAW